MRTLLIACLLSFGTSVFAQDWFAEGNAAYSRQSYDSAQVAFQHLVQDHPTFEAYYNLGNAEFRLGHFAEAILSYERARLLNPFDEDLLANLQVAEGRIQDEIETLDSAGFGSFFQALQSKRALGWYTAACLVFALLCAVCLTLSLLKAGGRRSFRGLAVLMGVGFVFSLGLGLMAKASLNDSDLAIIMAPSIDVQTAPDGGDIAFVLHAGTKVQVREANDSWGSIEIANGEVGWIPMEALAFIAQKK